MSRKIITILVILAICIGIYFYFLENKISTSSDYNELISVIDSLNCKIDSLSLEREELISKIDSSKDKVEVIEHWYEKQYNTVLTQPIDSDCVFFSKYLSSHFK